MKAADQLPLRGTFVLVVCPRCRLVQRVEVGIVFIQPPRFGVSLKCRPATRWGVFTTPDVHSPEDGWFDAADEDTTWCRETEGEAADAFRAAAALS